MKEFPEEYQLLKDGHEVPQHSHLVDLTPEYNSYRADKSGWTTLSKWDFGPWSYYPIVLEPKNHVTKLLAADLDSTLCHPGPQRMFAQLHWTYWVLRQLTVNKKNSQVMYADSELLTCRKWRHSQVLDDRFWDSFVKDYLPNLQIRQKWKLLMVILLLLQQWSGLWTPIFLVDTGL